MKSAYKITSRLVYLFLFVFLTIPIYAQLPEEIKWKHLEKTYNTDSSQLLLSLNNKLLQGQYKIPLDEGGFALYNIKKGMITGDAFWYSQSRRMECKLQYKNGVRNGLKENYDNQGKVWLRQVYRDGKLNGLDEMFSNGKLVNKSNYKNGLKHGLQYSYMSGTLISETNYIDGLKNGPSKTYSPNGEISMEINYKDDKRSGLYRTYANGELIMEVNYLNGIENGLSTSYALGKKTMDFEYVNGKRQGIGHMYKPDGSILFTQYYINGEMVKKDIYEKYQQSQKKSNLD